MRVPEFNMLIGLPGSGKSTIAHKYIDNSAIILSSDEIREELFGDASIQKDPQKVFSLMEERTLEALNKGFDVCYDATNLTRKNRANILSKLPLGTKKRAIIVFCPIELCIVRDAARDRTVGAEVINRMAKSFQVPYYDEGFDSIVITTEERYNKEEQKKIREAMAIPHDNPHHTYGIKNHCDAAFKYLRERESLYPIWIYEAAYWHDVGKPYCKTFTNTKGEPTDIAHYYGHQNVGAWIACGLLTDIYSIWLINNHMEPYFNSKYYLNLPKYLKEDIDLIHEADLAAH